MGRVIVVQPGRAVVEIPLALPFVPLPQDDRAGIQTAVAADRIEAFRAVRFVSENSVAHAATPSAQHAGAVCGVAIEPANPGQYVRYRTEGVERIRGAQFVPDEPVFSGFAGVLTQSTSGLDADVQIGTAITAEALLIRIELPVYRGVLS